MPTTDSTTNRHAHVYDILGVGFGPSNLAMAIAIAEHDTPLDAMFLERQAGFGWHRGMLIDGATMQISFLKDLATMRNPRSSYSFLSYLWAKDRLVDFINLKDFYPTRLEFHDYFSWVADRLDHLVTYDTEVTGVEPVRVDGVITHFAVRTGVRDRAYLARNVVLALGLRPRLPDGIRSGNRVWHNHEMLHRLPHLAGRGPRRFVVVGAGQSAAETTDYLHRTYPAAEVCTVLSRYGFSPADDTPFANRIFDPMAVSDYFGADADTKRSLLRYHANTNYSAVDIDLIEELYRRHYRELVSGHERMRFLRASRVVGVTEHADRVAVRVLNRLDGVESELAADAIVFATGYHPPDHPAALRSLDDLLVRDEDGRPAVGRDYRVTLRSDSLGGIYLQGGTEHSHGITSSLLSLSAVRAGEILSSMTSKENCDH